MFNPNEWKRRADGAIVTEGGQVICENVSPQNAALITMYEFLRVVAESSTDGCVGVEVDEDEDDEAEHCGGCEHHGSLASYAHDLVKAADGTGPALLLPFARG